jgi:hypothetical protein
VLWLGVLWKMENALRSVENGLMNSQGKIEIITDKFG